jgi:hypothetical protein
MTTLTLMIYSEHLFWARPGPWVTIRELAPTFLAYAMTTYIFLAAIAWFRVRSLPSLFLAAAIYGWFLEGVIVQTMYDDFPLNLSFTGLAWHALISVLLGWVVMPACLSGGAVRRTVALAAGIGAGYGLWSLWWWTIEPPAEPPAAFVAYSLGLTFALMLSYGLAPRLGLKAFCPSRLELGGLLALAAAWYAVVTLPTQPISMIVLPPLVALVWMGLAANRREERRPDHLQALLARRPPGIKDLAALLALPATATGVYVLATWMNIEPPTGIVLYLITVPLGFAALVWALVKTLHRAAPAQAVDAAAAGAPPAPTA